MDPNKTLEELREAVKSAMEHESYEAEYICERFQALDEWLSQGGMLPKDWMLP